MRGQGRIFQRKGTSALWLDYYCSGKRYRESAETSDWEEAKKRLARRLKEVGAEEIGARKFVGPMQQRVKVGELLDALQADYELRGKVTPVFSSQLEAVRQAFGERRAVQLTEEAIDRYIAECLESGAKPATVNRKLQLLGQAFRLAVRRKRLSAAPFIRRLSENGNARQGFFEDAEFRAMVAHLPEYLKGFATFGYLTGWRKGEIASLRWSDVDLRGQVIRLRPEESKNGEGRSVALESELLEIIEGQQDKRGASEYVFHRGGRRVGDFRQAWWGACVRAGVGRFDKQGKAKIYIGPIFHDLRRTAVRNMVRAGVPERVAMAISGHKTRSMLDRYNIVSEGDLREAARKTQEYLATIPAEQPRVPLATNRIQ